MEREGSLAADFQDLGVGRTAGQAYHLDTLSSSVLPLRKRLPFDAFGFCFCKRPFPRNMTTSWLITSSGEPDSTDVVVFVWVVGRLRSPTKTFNPLLEKKVLVKKVILILSGYHDNGESACAGRHDGRDLINSAYQAREKRLLVLWCGKCHFIVRSQLAI